MDPFPPYCSHCNSLGHSKLDCPILAPSLPPVQNKVDCVTVDLSPVLNNSSSVIVVPSNKNFMLNLCPGELPVILGSSVDALVESLVVVASISPDMSSLPVMKLGHDVEVLNVDVEPSPVIESTANNELGYMDELGRVVSSDCKSDGEGVVGTFDYFPLLRSALAPLLAGVCFGGSSVVVNSVAVKDGVNPTLGSDGLADLSVITRVGVVSPGPSSDVVASPSSLVDGSGQRRLNGLVGSDMTLVTSVLSHEHLDESPQAGHLVDIPINVVSPKALVRQVGNNLGEVVKLQLDWLYGSSDSDSEVNGEVEPVLRMDSNKYRLGFPVASRGRGKRGRK